MSDTTTPEPLSDLPPSQMDDTDLAAYVRREVRLDWEAAGQWREEAREAYDFVAGRQWDSEDIAILTEEKRPPVTFNRVAAMIDAVCGAQVNNRNEIKYLQRSMDDGGKAELLNGVARWVMDQTDAEDEDSEAFRDVAIGGMGWTEMRMDYEEDPEGRIIIERRDPFEMGWDRTARRRNLSDARHIWSRQKFPAEVVAARWPEFDDVVSAGKAMTTEGLNTTPVNPTRDRYAEGDTQAQDTADTQTVTHFQWCESRALVRVLNPANGAMEVLTEEAWDALEEKIGEDQRDLLRHVKQTEKRWYQVFECGGETTKVEECPDRFGPTFKCITGRWDRNRRVFYGLVRSVKDPQMWANKWLSQSLHIINTNAKSGVLYEESAVDNVRKFETEYAKTGSAVKVRDGALSRGAIRDKIAPPFPQGFDRLLQFAIGSMPDVTGINREMLGTVDREQAGILEAQRKQASQAVLAPLFDSMRRYHKEQGRLLMVFMAKFIPPGKAIRITGEDGTPKQVFWQQLDDAAQYDVVVDQAPTSPNQKSEVWMALQPMLPVLVKEVPPPVLLELMKFSPLPESVVQGIQKKLDELAQQPKPPDPALVKVQADMQAQEARAKMELEMKQADMAQAQQMAELEYQTEMRKAQMDLELQRIKAANEMEIARMRAEHDARIKQQTAETDIMIADRKAQSDAQARMDSMKAERGVLAEPVREIVAPVQDVLGQMVQVLADMRQAAAEEAQHSQAMMAELRSLVAAEKEIVRGPDGRVAGTRIKAPVLN